MNLCAKRHIRYINAIPSRNGHETCMSHNPNAVADPTKPTNILYIVVAFKPIDANTAVEVASNEGIYCYILKLCSYSDDLNTDTGIIVRYRHDNPKSAQNHAFVQI